MPQIGRTADFVSSLGVNTHIAYTNSNYVHIGNVVSDLKYIGLSLVRDSGFDPTWDPVGQLNYGVAAAAGIKFDFVVGPGIRISTRLGLFDSFANAHPGSIASFEGP